MSLIPLAIAVGFTLGLFTAYVAQYRTPCGNNSIGHRLAHIFGTNSFSLCWAEIGRMAGEVMAIGLQKGSDNMSKGLTEMPKVGEKVRYVGEECGFLTVGKDYEVTDVNNRYFSYVDDVGDTLNEDEFDVFELVTESLPSIVDLLANLGRRVSEVEAELAAAKKSPVNRFGYDAEVNYDTDNRKTSVLVTFDDLISGDLAVERTIAVMKEWNSYE